MTGVIFVDLTTACDTAIAYKLGFDRKLVRFPLDNYMARMIMELVQNRSFTLTNGDSKQMRKWDNWPQLTGHKVIEKGNLLLAYSKY